MHKIAMIAVVAIGLAAACRVASVAQTAAGTAPPAAATCDTPNREASIINAYSPQLSYDQLRQAKADGAGDSIQVRVLVGPDGSVQQVAMFKSSGNDVLDNAAMAAAKQSVYTPKLANCRPVIGAYLYVVDLRF
jgi:protein TonB